MKEITGIKAFNNDLKCRDFQFEIGKSYTVDGTIKACNHGFHFCQNPLDTLSYYPLIDNNGNLTRFAKVKGTGSVDLSEKDKVCVSNIEIIEELQLKDFINNGVEFLLKEGSTSETASSGDCSQLASSGYGSKLASSGNGSQLASSGDCSQLATTGENSVIANIGINGQAKGIIGTWITLAEYKWSEGKYICILCKCTKIDGIIIKENTYYKLEDGEFIEA